MRSVSCDLPCQFCSAGRDGPGLGAVRAGPRAALDEGRGRELVARVVDPGRLDHVPLRVASGPQLPLGAGLELDMGPRRDRAGNVVVPERRRLGQVARRLIRNLGARVPVDPAGRAGLFLSAVLLAGSVKVVGKCIRHRAVLAASPAQPRLCVLADGREIVAVVFQEYRIRGQVDHWSPVVQTASVHHARSGERGLPIPCVLSFRSPPQLHDVVVNLDVKVVGVFLATDRRKNSTSTNEQVRKESGEGQHRSSAQAAPRCSSKLSDGEFSPTASTLTQLKG